MHVEFLEVAEQELAEAIEYYNRQRAGLGDEFLVELLLTVKRIQRYPGAWQALSPQVRRCRPRRFPCGIIYRHTAETVLVVAVAHSHRKPDYWADRLPR